MLVAGFIAAAQMEKNMSNRWIDAEPCGPEHRLTDVQVDQWRTAGFTFVNGLFPADLIGELTTSARENFPSANSDDALNYTNFGSGGRLIFPSQGRFTQPGHPSRKTPQQPGGIVV